MPLIVALFLLSQFLTGGAIDQWLARYSSSGVNWYLSDRLGSVTGITDSSGNLINSTIYNSYGRILSQSNPTAADSLAFTGREYDTETGLYYFRARYYNPDLGRFQSEDPIQFKAGDDNLLRYALNGPLNYLDPQGKAALEEYGQTNKNSAEETESVAETETVFYTGGADAREAAQAYAAANGANILSIPASEVDSITLELQISREEFIDQVSGMTAANAEQAVVFVGRGGIQAESVFARIEQKILEAYGIPTRIVYL